MTVLRFTLIALLTLIFVGCSSETPAPITPTVDLPTIAVPTPNIEATVQARVAQELAAQPTATPTAVPTATAIPTKVVLPTPTLHHEQEEQESPISESTCINSTFTVSGVVSGYPDQAIVEGVLHNDAVVGVSVVDGNAGASGNYSLSVNMCDENGQSIEDQYMKIKVNGSFTNQEVLLIPNMTINRDITVTNVVSGCKDAQFTVSGKTGGIYSGPVVGTIKGVAVATSLIQFSFAGGGSYQLTVDVCRDDGTSLENQNMSFTLDGRDADQQVIVTPGLISTQDLSLAPVPQCPIIQSALPNPLYGYDTRDEYYNVELGESPIAVSLLEWNHYDMGDAVRITGKIHNRYNIVIREIRLKVIGEFDYPPDAAVWGYSDIYEFVEFKNINPCQIVDFEVYATGLESETYTGYNVNPHSEYGDGTFADWEIDTYW